MKAKNYIAISGILNKAFKQIPKEKENTAEMGRFTTLVFNLTEYLKTTNPKFDEDRFLKAVYKS